jgi:F0F1-type ATP synthase epsilon subunit
VEIVTAQGLFWRGEADMVIMQTVEGEMAVMHGHIPLWPH